MCFVCGDENKIKNESNVEKSPDCKKAQGGMCCSKCAVWTASSTEIIRTLLYKIFTEHTKLLALHTVT